VVPYPWHYNTCLPAEASSEPPCWPAPMKRPPDLIYLLHHHLPTLWAPVMPCAKKTRAPSASSVSRCVVLWRIGRLSVVCPPHAGAFRHSADTPYYLRWLEIAIQPSPIYAVEITGGDGVSYFYSYHISDLFLTPSTRMDGYWLIHVTCDCSVSGWMWWISAIGCHSCWAEALVRCVIDLQLHDGPPCCRTVCAFIAFVTVEG
jgi:hypothetical protein